MVMVFGVVCLAEGGSSYRMPGYGYGGYGYGYPYSFGYGLWGGYGEENVEEKEVAETHEVNETAAEMTEEHFENANDQEAEESQIQVNL